MPKPLTSVAPFSSPATPSRVKSRIPGRTAFSLVYAALALGGLATGAPARAQAPSSPAAPPALTQLIAQLDQASSREDLRGVLRFYSNAFSHSDGLTTATLDDALRSFWSRHENLRYNTVINSWQQEGNALIAETTTTVTGVQQSGSRTFNLTSTIRSRQRYEGDRIVRQDILSEQSRLTSGQRPPTVEIKLPERVAPGRDFNFDAIVQEPLGDRLLLGAAIEEPVTANGYLTTPRINMELLSAGGLFKVGRAPATPGSRWLSAVIVRDDGITIETRRLQVGANEQP